MDVDAPGVTSRIKIGKTGFYQSQVESRRHWLQAKTKC